MLLLLSFWNDVANLRSAIIQNIPGKVNARELIDIAEINSKIKPMSYKIVERNTSEQNKISVTIRYVTYGISL